jgi:hypothetical protein
VREVTKIVYEAFDGSTFDTVAKCVAYERDNAHSKLIGLTEAQVLEALKGEGEIADAIKTIGYRIAMAAKKPAKPRKKADKDPELPPPVGIPPVPPMSGMTAAEAEARTL